MYKIYYLVLTKQKKKVSKSLLSLIYAQDLFSLSKSKVQLIFHLKIKLQNIHNMLPILLKKKKHCNSIYK